MKKAFTLMELLVVVAIMGLLGTISVGGYRAMQRGMEERGVMQNVNEFVRAAYQRAQIDRVPVAVYFWNELLREETDNAPAIVVGKAVAVRRAGRLSECVGSYLYDEFGDLRFNRLILDEDEDDETAEEDATSSTGGGVFLYPMNGGARDGSSFKRSTVNAASVRRTLNEPMLLGGNVRKPIEAYAFYVSDPGGVDWRRGDAYGFEFAELELPHNFIFGTAYSRSLANPVTEVKKINFKVGKNTGSGAVNALDGDYSIRVSSLRPGSSGEIEAQKVNDSDDPSN